ncbi:unnamed protein product [Lampetra planeri]
MLLPIRAGSASQAVPSRHRLGSRLRDSWLHPSCRHVGLTSQDVDNAIVDNAVKRGHSLAQGAFLACTLLLLLLLLMMMMIIGRLVYK